MSTKKISNRNLGQVDRLPVGQFKSDKWPVLHVGKVPVYGDATPWDLTIHGYVENPMTINWDMLMDLPRSTVEADMHCVTTWSTFDNVLGGVRFTDLMDIVKPQKEAIYVRMVGESGYDSSLPLMDLMEEDVLLCYLWSGHPLPAVHGGPLRIMIPKKYAWKSVKWLRILEFMGTNKLGYWEQRGYSNTANPWKNDRYGK